MQYPRLCPGKHFAQTTMWLTIATVLSVFDIRPYVDPETGMELLPNTQDTDSGPVA